MARRSSEVTLAMDARSDTTNGMSLDAWMGVLRAVPDLAAVEVSRDEQRALLDLTRVAAHRSERVAAPITAYPAGLVLASAEPAQRAERIRDLAALLESGARNDPARVCRDATRTGPGS